MFPPIAAIDDHFKAKDTTDTRKKCNGVIRSFFCEGKNSLLGAQSSGTMKKQAFYNEKLSLLIFHKLMHASALKKLYPFHKNIPFLEVGIYHGCKNKPRDDIRDTLYFKNENSTNDFRKVTTFREF